MKTSPAVLSVLIWGCASSMVLTPGASDVENAPVNELNRPGIVRYLNEGIGSVRASRRADAYKKMRESCKGPYKIDAEGERVDGGIVVADSTMAAALPTHYLYIQFSCVRDSAAK